MSVLKRLKKFSQKAYRDDYLATHVRSSIAYQIQALRRKAGLTQVQMGNIIGKPQSVVSRLEDSDYGTVSVKTLLDIAQGLDVALLVRFVSYQEFLRWSSRMSESELAVETVYESLERCAYSPQTYTVPRSQATANLTISTYNLGGSATRYAQ